ncbi:MAG TPA: SMC family ATPase [Thermoplasmata archaeon]|nr:SMC family ATPase [Thermoplasmata archaeon]
MLVRSVAVRNVRSYTSATLRLGEGITLLTGDVGSGKTSLLHAIEMALFGFAEVEPAFLVRHRARDAEVNLTLGEAEHTYELRRRFRRRTVRGKESFEIEESSFAADGHRTKYSATELRQRAIDLLGFPDNPNPHAHSDVWRWAVYIPQERMREVLVQRPPERLGTVRKALGLEQYQTAAENAQELGAELRRIAEVHEAAAEQLRPWTDELPRWSAIRVTRSRELAELEGEERRRRETATAADEARRRAEATFAERQSLAAELERWVADSAERHAKSVELQTRERAARTEAERLRTGAAAAEHESAQLAREGGDSAPLRSRLSDLRARTRESEQVAVELAQIEAMLRATREAVTQLDERDGRLDTEEQATRTAVREAEAAGPPLEPTAPTPRSLEEIEADRAQRETEFRTAESQQLRLEHVAEDLRGLVQAGVCPRCHQAVRPQEFASHLEQAKTEAAQAQSAATEAKAVLRRVEDERGARERFERARDRFVEVDKRRTSARGRLETVSADRARIRTDRAERIREVASLEQRSGVLGPAAERRSAELSALKEVEALLGRSEEAARRAADRLEEARRLSGRAELVDEQAARDAAEGGRLEREARALAERADRRRTEWAGRPDPASAIAPAREVAEAARAEVERVVARVAATQAGLEEADRRIIESDRSVRIRAERIAEANQSRALSAWLAREFREGLLDLEHRRLAQAQTEFNRAFARYFQTLVEDPNLVARCDLAFSPLVEIDGDPTPAEALSGGERTALALAFRLAMGRVVRGAGRLRLETLILDEPTDGFSPEQVLRMGELLEELRIPQVLIVSHEAALAGIADHVVRVSKTGGASQLSYGPGDREASASAPGDPSGPSSPVGPAVRRRVRRPPQLTPDDGGTPPDPTAEAPPASGSR